MVETRIGRKQIAIELYILLLSKSQNKGIAITKHTPEEKTQSIVLQIQNINNSNINNSLYANYNFHNFQAN